MFEKRSKNWPTIVNLLEKHFPKGECKERGRALCLIANIEMMLIGFEFDEDGNVIKKDENNIKN